jgi:hypothetical protein
MLGATGSRIRARAIRLRVQYVAFAVGFVIFTSGLPGWAQSHAPLQYRGGPVLETFRIYPLYYGNWTQSDINAKQSFLQGLAGYISGQNAPPFQQPMMKEYGVNQATLANAVMTTTPFYTVGRLAKADLLNIIHANQISGKLPPYSPNTLIMISQGGTCSTTGYTSLGEIQDYGVSYTQYRADYDRLGQQGWRLYNLQSFALANGTACYNAVWRPGNGPEIQVYGWTYADYRGSMTSCGRRAGVSISSNPTGWQTDRCCTMLSGDRALWTGPYKKQWSRK